MEFLVIGATGKQGGAVVRALLEKGCQVRGLTRYPNGPRAQALVALGCQVVKGDMEQVDSLEAAMEGVDGVFSIQNYWDGLPETFLGYEGEVRQGRNVADAAARTGIAHIVQSTAAGANAGTGVDHLDSKGEVEAYLVNSGVGFTILRPVFFMSHFLGRGYPGFQPRYAKGFLKAAFPAQKPLQMISIEDIGAIAAHALTNPDTMMGQSMDIATDELTLPEALEMIGKEMDTAFSYVEQPLGEIEGQQMLKMATWLVDPGYSADPNLFTQLGLQGTRFSDWVKGQDFSGVKWS